MTLPRRLLLLGIIVVVSSACGKPNPRIASIVEKQADDDPDEEFDFSYDDQNRLTRVERTEGDDSEVWEITWDGSLLAKVVVKEEFNGNLTEVESVLTWENGRLVSVKRDADGDESDATYTYDGSGRLSEIASDGDDTDTVTTVNYDDAGRVVSLESENESAAGLTKTEIELDRNEEQITTLTLSQEGEEFISLDILYDEDTKRVDATEADFETLINGEQKVVTARSVFSYADNGLLESVANTAEVDNIEADVSDVEVTYEDGDASALDVTPGKIFFGLGILFDMKGFSHGSIDNTAGVPRTAFESW